MTTVSSVVAGVSRQTRRRVIISALALLLLCSVACGVAVEASPGAGGPARDLAPTPPAATPSGHQFTATLEVTGAVTQSRSFTMDLTGLPSCSALADGAYDGTAMVPFPHAGTLRLDWNMDRYPGPGTYTDPSSFANSVDLTVPTGGELDEYQEVPGSVLSLTVNPDASGSATFQDLQDWQNHSVSGSETWTCG